MWLLTFSSVWGQQANVSTRTFDLNGHAVQGVGTIQSGPTRSPVTRDLNGRTVPVDSVEERVVSDAGGVRTTERIVKRYDPNGNPGPAERVRIEERKQPDGSISTAATIERGDINGAFQLAERSTTLTRTAGTRTESTTTVERPTLNGSMEVIERRDQAINTESNKTTERASTLRRDANGRLTEFAKKDREVISSNGQT